MATKILDDAETAATLDIATALTQLIDAGFEAPLYVASVALNGTLVYGVYRTVERHLEYEVLAEHSGDDAVMALPVHMMVVDRRGVVAHGTFAVDGGPPQIVH